MKRLCAYLGAALLLLNLTAGCSRPPEAAEDGRLRVVATVFPAYDFARSAGGDLAEVELLLPPGAESHSYEPTPADILAVQECDLFLYLGGESDTWVDTILESVEPEGRVLRMVDCVPLLEEETVEGMETFEEGHDHDGHDHGLGEVVGYDEHVWTSPRNAAAVTRAVGSVLGEIDPANAGVYAANAEGYAAELDALDRRFADFFAGVKDRTMVFGDRFPLRYFAEEFDIDYYAAFPGVQHPDGALGGHRGLPDGQGSAGAHLHRVVYRVLQPSGGGQHRRGRRGGDGPVPHLPQHLTEDLEAGATYASLMEGNLEALEQHMA